ncbi:4Fe-4S binding protein [Oxobacter pfennigii]
MIESRFIQVNQGKCIRCRLCMKACRRTLEMSTSSANKAC